MKYMESGIPDNIPDAIDYLELKLRDDIASTEDRVPSPDAPVGEQIASALRAKRLEADTEFIEELRESHSFASKIKDDNS